MDFFSVYKKTAWNKDAKAMLQMYDQELVVFDMWDKGYINGFDDWSSFITDWLETLGEERVNVEFEMVKVMQGENIGFATALIIFQAISPEGNVLRGMKNRITVGFGKKLNEWTVVHQHVSAPTSSSGLKAILDI